jgi:predicted ATPase
VGVAPFHRRVPQANIIDLDPLTKANTLKLIEMRMKTRKSPLKPPYIPFTDDFIDYIYQMTKGRPSEIIMLCDMIFLEAHDKKLLEVDRKSAKEILLKLGLRAEPE